MKQLLTVFFCSLTLFCFSQDQDSFEMIHKMLNNHFKQYPSENIFVQTDRDLYRAGDIVWFTGFARNPALNGLGTVSDNLVVVVYDEAGEPINEDKYKMVGGLCRGDFDLPKDIDPGRYVLAAYSGGTIFPNEVFMKLIYVDQFNSNSLLVKTEENVKTLVPGRLNELLFVVSEMDGKAFEGKVNYQLMNGSELIIDGKVKADENGLVRLNIDVPDRQFDQPLTLTLLDGRAEVYSSMFHIESEKISLQFSAEGGNFIAGIRQNIAFRATNTLGQAVSLKAALQEKTSEDQIMQVNTLAPGLGIFPLTAKVGKTYQLKVTEGAGKGQVFDLPEYKAEGVSLAVGRMDEGFIYSTVNLVGMSSKDLIFAAFRGGTMIWGAELTVDGGLSLKVPKDGFSHGICQLMIFDQQLKPLADRLIYVEKEGDLAIDAVLAQNPIERNTAEGLKIGLLDENESTLAGVATISVCPKALLSLDAPSIESQLMVNGWLESPISSVKQLVRSGKLSESSINYLLIGNQFRNSDWKSIQQSQKTVKQAEGISRVRLEEDLPKQVESFLNQHVFDRKPEFTVEFFTENPTLFQKVKPKRTIAAQGNSYKQFLSSGSSVLDAIEMIKPFTMDGDKIIFPGGNNSLIAQDGALIVIDGQKMGTSASVLASISPHDVESIDISTRPIDIQQYTGLNSVGLIDIKTKRGEWVDEAEEEPIKQYEGGNRISRDFTETIVSMDDNQSLTLFWEPAMGVDELVNQQLPASKTKGTFVVQVLAIDNQGRVASKSIELDVK
ncbi:MG2 domain-containing protein [Mangrovibacterium lignilyticum]|uniref:MG2 domain-containing protein n=1 Tax=Mangrovibacterium lignilyticum TaxID=2668052 RepID=UPI0013D82015|nr:MG2 domain-containing protein [Mangrovibacterium lignilyticum]